MKHDALVTLFASFTGSLIEISLCYLWSTGKIASDFDFNENFWFNIFCGATVTFWRIPHFHVLHRGMHPWRTTNFPDIGKDWLSQNFLNHKLCVTYIPIKVALSKSSRFAPQKLQSDCFQRNQYASSRVNFVLLCSLCSLSVVRSSSISFRSGSLQLP